MDLYQEITRLMAELDAAIGKMRKNGVAKAEAERDYKIALRQEALKLKEAGMSATLINSVIYGVPCVAEKRFQRDVAEVNYDVNKEFINVCKLDLKTLNAQLSREWGAAGKGDI